ncbi:MAG: extracellular solute-binding protein, partial [Candidatus Competibacteraceae bacterium]|nr:extracellular solute-binding protein [Candidatus Competibacteraceae bacterium]
MKTTGRIAILSLVVLVIAAAAAVAGGQKDAAKSGGAVQMNATGLPIVKSPVTYTMVTRKRVINGPYEDMIFFKRLEEKTGVKIEWNAIPEGQYEEKKNLILASNDLPDAFFGRLSLRSSDIVLYSSQKAFIPLEDLIAKYAPRLTAIFKDRPDFKAMAVAPDNKIYSTPFAYSVGVANVPTNMFIYKPWLDKLGLKVPTTVDEFHATLKAFKERDPNGNGKADEVPFTFIFNDTQYDIGASSALRTRGLPGGPNGTDHVVSRERQDRFRTI